MNLNRTSCAAPLVAALAFLLAALPPLALAQTVRRTSCPKWAPRRRRR